MTRFLREFRLIPLVLFATVSLFALKVGALLTYGGYTLGSPRPAQAEDAGPPAGNPKRSWAQDVLGYPDITGSVITPKQADRELQPAAKGDAAKPAGTSPAATSAQPGGEGTPVPATGRAVSGAERAVLERLQERRQELDLRARELDIRESLMTAAEKRIEARIVELKDVEARINATATKKDEAEIARFKSLVTMYENMKAKDAAKVFDRLDIKILIEVASQISPRRMSDILAQMSAEAAERLTVELAGRTHGTDRTPSDLPKIVGRPTVP